MNNLKGIIGCVLILCGFVGVIVCAISSCVFTLRNPDMTELRRFLDNPSPTIWCIIDYIGIMIGMWMVRSK